MIKKIIACSDIHIRSLQREGETVEILKELFKDIKAEMEGYDENEVRIVVAGDIFEAKIDVTNEGLVKVNWFLKELDKIAPTIVIAGNHDYNEHNMERLDTLSAVFGIGSFNRVTYLDKELEYHSGCYEDDNIVWCLYSTFELFNRPEITAAKRRFPNHKYIGLVHGEINGCKNDVGNVFCNGLEKTTFKGLDFVIAGHIHRRQELKSNGVKIVYCGSVIQQNNGENVYGHGYVVWNVEDNSYEFKDVDNHGYGYYKYEINDVEDIKNNKEKLINLS